MVSVCEAGGAVSLLYDKIGSVSEGLRGSDVGVSVLSGDAHCLDASVPVYTRNMALFATLVVVCTVHDAFDSFGSVVRGYLREMCSEPVDHASVSHAERESFASDTAEVCGYEEVARVTSVCARVSLRVRCVVLFVSTTLLKSSDEARSLSGSVRLDCACLYEECSEVMSVVPDCEGCDEKC